MDDTFLLCDCPKIQRALFGQPHVSASWIGDKFVSVQNLSASQARAVTKTDIPNAFVNNFSWSAASKVAPMLALDLCVGDNVLRGHVS